MGLRDEDVAAIEKRVLAPKQAEYEQQQEAERLKLEQERAESQEQLRQKYKPLIAGITTLIAFALLLLLIPIPEKPSVLDTIESPTDNNR